MIASCLPDPVAYQVSHPTRYMFSRQAWIVRQMNNLEGDPDMQNLMK